MMVLPTSFDIASMVNSEGVIPCTHSTDGELTTIIINTNQSMPYDTNIGGMGFSERLETGDWRLETGD